MALKKSDRQLIDEAFAVLVEHFRHGKEECYESAECECEEGEAINLAGEALARLDREADSLREQVRTLTAERDEARCDWVKAKHALEGYATALEGAEKEADALREQVAELEEEHEEDQGVIRVWRGRTERAEAERDAAQQRAKALKADATRAAAELRHAFKVKQDWNLIARAVEVLERATTKEDAP